MPASTVEYACEQLVPPVVFHLKVQQVQRAAATSTCAAINDMLDQVDNILARVRHLVAANVDDKARARQAKALLQSVQKHLSVSQDPSTSERFWIVKVTAACRLLSAALSLNGRVPNRQCWPLAAQLLQASAQLYHPGPTATAGLSPQQVTKCQLVMAQECKKHDVLMIVARALEAAASPFRGPVEVSVGFLAAGCSCAKPTAAGQPVGLHELQYITSLLQLFHAINSMWPGQAGVLTTQEGRKAAGAAYEVAVVLVEQAAALEINSHSSEAAACAQEMVSAAAEAASLLTAQISRRLQGAWAVRHDPSAGSFPLCSHAARVAHNEQVELMTPAFTHMLLLLAGIQLQQHYSSSGHPSGQDVPSQTAVNITSSSNSSAVAFLQQYHTQLLKSFGGLSEQLFNTAVTAAAGSMTSLLATLSLLAETPSWLEGRVHPCRNHDPECFGNYARDFVNSGLLGFLMPVLLRIARDCLQCSDWAQAETVLSIVSLGSACWNYCSSASLVPFDASAAELQLLAQFVGQQQHMQAQLLQQLAISLQDISVAAAGAAGADGQAAGLCSSSRKLSRRVASKGQYAGWAPRAGPTASQGDPEQPDAHALYVLLDLLLAHTLTAAKWISTGQFDSCCNQQLAPLAASLNTTNQPAVLSAEQLQLTFLGAIEQCVRTLSSAAAAAGEKRSAYAVKALIGVLQAPVCTLGKPHMGQSGFYMPGFADPDPGKGRRLAAAATAHSIVAAAAGSATHAAASAVALAAASKQGMAGSTVCQGPPVTARQKQLFSLLASLLKSSDHTVYSWEISDWVQHVAAAALNKIVPCQQQQQQGTHAVGTPVAAAAVVPPAAVPWLHIMVQWTATYVGILDQLISPDRTRTSETETATAAEEASSSESSVGCKLEPSLSQESANYLNYMHFHTAFATQNGISNLFQHLNTFVHSDTTSIHMAQPLAASTAASAGHSPATVLQQKIPGLWRQWQQAKEVFAYYYESLPSGQSLRWHGAATPAAKPLPLHGEPAATVAGELVAADSATARWQVIRDSFIAALPQQLEAAVRELAASLPLALCCNNPSCSNMSRQSELQLVGGKSCVCAGCEVARYCGRECQAAHWQAHKRVCKIIKKSKAAASASDRSQITDQQ